MFWLEFFCCYSNQYSPRLLLRRPQKKCILFLIPIKHLIFEPSKECFHNAIVVAIPFSGHGLNDLMFPKLTSIGSVLVLPALIRMHNQSIHRGKAFKRLTEHILNLLHIRAERKIIRDNFIGIHVKDWRKVALSPGERKLRHIGCPFLQGSVCAEVPVDDIGGYLAHFPPIGMVFLLGTFPGQSQPIHNTLNPLMIHREATPCKFLIYSSYAISSFVFLEDTLNFRGYICISLLNFIWFSNLIIIGRLRQLHHCQQIFQGISFFTEFLTSAAFSP